MDTWALVLMLPAERMRETPNTCANSAYARPLPAVTVLGLRLAGHATWHRAGMVPGTATATATAMATLLTVRGVHAACRARRPTGVTAPQARTVPGLRLVRRAARRLAGLAWMATLLTTATICAASSGRQRVVVRHARLQAAWSAVIVAAGC
jgi:hypothetical protein